MPSHSFLSKLSEEETKGVLIEICRSPTSAQNLERIVRCLLQFWDPARCALVIDKDVVPEIFPSLNYGPDVIENTDISSLAVLDIKVFLHLCLHCTYVRNERVKEKAGTNVRKLPSFTASEQLTTERQRSWWRAAWSLCNGVGKQEDRIRLHEGLEILRLKSRDMPEVPLLLSVAAMLENEIPDDSRYNESDAKAVAASDYGKLYWSTIDQIFERDRIVQSKPDAMFYAGLTPLPRSRRDHYQSLAKYYYALNALMHGKDDEAVTILEQLKTPQAFFALAQIYKNSAEKVVGRASDQDVELRRRGLLMKAKDALQSTMAKLNAQAGNGGLNVLDITKSLEELNASLAAVDASPLLAPAGDGDLSNISTIAPLASSTLSFSTPASRFVTARSVLGGNNAQASSSLLLELGQSVDFALRTLTQSQETLVQGVMDQNRALTNTCGGMIEQLKELTLTNKALVEEMKEIRRENAEYRAALSGVESVRGRSQLAEEAYHSQTAAAAPPQLPVFYNYQQPQQPLQLFHQPLSQQFQPSALQQLQQHCQQFLPLQQQQQQGLPATMQAPKKTQGPAPAFSEMEMFKPKPGSWECKDCYTRNDATSSKCVCCGGAGPATTASSSLTTTAFPPPVTSAVFGSTLPISVFGLPTATTATSAATPVSSKTTAATTGAMVADGTVAGTTTVTTANGFSAPLFGSSKANTGLSFADLAAAAATTAAPFQSFQGFEGAGTPVFGTVKTSTPERTRQESENDDSTDTPFEPTAEFKPVIPLPALVETKSGEEDEEVLFRERAKLYRWGMDAEGKEGFKERGVGDLKILKHHETGRIRILMRREQVLKICANHTLHVGMKLTPMRNTDKAFTWHCQDYSDGELKSETLAVRFKDAEQAQKFKEVFEASVASLEASSGSAADTSERSEAGADVTVDSESKESQDESQAGSTADTVVTVVESKPPLSQLEMFKPKPGSWACNECYTRNDATSSKCICCGSANTTTASSIQSTAAAFPPPVTTGVLGSTFPTSVFGLPTATTATSAATPVSSKTTAATMGAMAADGTVAGTTTITAASGFSAPLFGWSKANTGLSFAALAAKSAAAAMTTAPFQSFQGFEGAGTPVFATVKTSTPERTRQESENDDNTDTPFEPTAEFKPVIPLPALVETKSGEEDEEVLFRERAKLYRWGMDAEGKEGFKERGVGDLKILKHHETGRVRILMRREQVLKICANHTLHVGMKLTPMRNTDKAFTWHCQDYSDGELKSETLAVRFKDAEQAQKFKEVFEASVASLEASSGSAADTSERSEAGADVTVDSESKETQDERQAGSTADTVVTVAESKLPLSHLEMFKPKPGSWECKDCYTRNDATSSKCVCCGGAGPATTASSSLIATAFPPPVTSAVFGSTLPISVFGLPTATSAATPISSKTTAATTGAMAADGTVAGTTTITTANGFSTPLATSATAAKSAAAAMTAAPFQSFQGFEGAGTPVFGSLKTSTPEGTRQESENDDSTDTPFEPTAEFKPVIPLPALVETKSGEEDEEVLFRERAKLFRWGVDAEGKEAFKERGVGDLKILKHRETGRIRILMRREQVLKICANHSLHSGMKLTPMRNTDKAFTWHCQDYSDGELKSETLAVRFKGAERAQEFKRVFEDAVVAMGKAEGVSPTKAVDIDAGAGDRKSEEEVSVVYETTASEEQASLAEHFQLPRTFYVEHSPCPGCIGCASEEAQDKIMRQLDHHEE